MKQNITEEQLNELSEKGKERLRDWWKPKEYDLCAIENSSEIYAWDEFSDDMVSYLEDLKSLKTNDESEEIDKMYPLLSIGQMIEFLDEHKDNDDFVPLAIDRGEFEWHVYSISNKPSSRSVELCDALWLAVKEVLEK